MFRLLQRFGRDRQARRRGTGPLNRVRRRNHPLNCEALESRQLLSAYYIVNLDSGKVLDNSGFSTSSGTPIDQWQFYGGANQQWNLIKQPNGTDEISKRAKRHGPSRPQLLQQRRYPNPADAVPRLPEPAMGAQRRCRPNGNRAYVIRQRL